MTEIRDDSELGWFFISRGRRVWSKPDASRCHSKHKRTLREGVRFHPSLQIKKLGSQGSMTLRSMPMSYGHRGLWIRCVYVHTSSWEAAMQEARADGLWMARRWLGELTTSSSQSGGLETSEASGGGCGLRQGSDSLFPLFFFFFNDSGRGMLTL